MTQHTQEQGSEERACEMCDGTGRDPQGDGGGWGAGSCPECGGTGKERGRGAARRLALAWVNDLRREAGLGVLDHWPTATETSDPLNLALPDGWQAWRTQPHNCGWWCRPDSEHTEILPNGPYYFLTYFQRGYYPDLEAAS